MNKDLIVECLNMDEWKHAWNNKLCSSNELEDAHSIILGKISDREREIKLLRAGIEEINKFKSVYDK